MEMRRTRKVIGAWNGREVLECGHLHRAATTPTKNIRRRCRWCELAADILRTIEAAPAPSAGAER